MFLFFNYDDLMLHEKPLTAAL